MNDILNNNNIKLLARHLPVDEQYELAKSLAANCGYQLVEVEVDPELVFIKSLISEFKRSDSIIVMSDENKALIVKGLEGLLK